MARTLSSLNVVMALEAAIASQITDGDGELVGVAGSQGFTYSPASLASGTSANQADRIVSFKGRALASAATENLDFYDLGSLNLYGAGAGRDAAGQLFTLAELVGLLIRNDAESVGTLLAGGLGAGTAFNSLFAGDDDAKLTLPPGAASFFFCPADPAWAIADSTNHLFKMEASGGDLTYSLALLGRSA